jgi:hypothetical protein
MKNKSNDILFLEELMQKAHFPQPASLKAKKNAVKSEKLVLKQVLKRTGQWSIFFGILFGFAYLLKKIKILFIANKLLSFITIISLGVGAYFTIEYIKNVKNETIVHNKLTDVKHTKIEKKQSKKIPVIENTKIELHDFTSTSVDTKILDIINKSISKGLKKSEGDRITKRINNKEYKIKYMIFGNVEEYRDSFQFYIKVIDGETSEVTGVLNKVIDKKRNIKKECRDISKQLSKKIR